MSYTINIADKEYNISNPVAALKAFKASKGNKRQREYLKNSRKDNFVLKFGNAISALIFKPHTWINEEDYVSENFYSGNETFLEAVKSDAKWSLGYSQRSILPDNVLKKKYYIAGFFRIVGNPVESVLDDIKIRAIALDDGTGRGKSVFAAIECLGICNGDIRKIRERLSEYAKENNVISINIQSTHTHSGIDTYGIYSKPLRRGFKNLLSFGGRIGKLKTGTDQEFMDNLFKRSEECITEACNSMKPGNLYYASKDIADYMHDKRMPSVMFTEMGRFRFVPDDGSKSTYIASVNIHPNTTGLHTDKSTGREISGDYVASMEKTVNDAGYDFMFIYGLTLGVNASRSLAKDGLPLKYRHDEAIRYGRELAYILLAMTMSENEIENSSFVDLKEIENEKKISANGYTLWYEKWSPVKEIEVEPILNISIKEKNMVVENPLIKIVSKLGLVNNIVIRCGKKILKTPTEVGYVELGTNIAFIMVPAEFMPEMVIGGGAMNEDMAYSCKKFQYAPLNEITGRKLLTMGIMNDAAGYILCDNDYSYALTGGERHYQELISYSRNTGSTTVEVIVEILKEKKRAVHI